MRIRGVERLIHTKKSKKFRNLFVNNKKGFLLNLLAKLLAAFLGKLRENKANDLTVVRGGDSHIGGKDSLLDRLQGRSVVGGDGQGSCVCHADICHRGDRCGRAVILKGYAGEHRGIRLTCTDGAEIILVSGDRLLHFFFMSLGFKFHIGYPFKVVYLCISVPIFSPSTTR